MKNAVLIFSLLMLNLHVPGQNWISQHEKGFNIQYLPENQAEIPLLNRYCNQAYAMVSGFFGQTFQKEFFIRIQPSRAAMDNQWSLDWNSPGFKSECWMVASGVAMGMDILAPSRWSSESCEHSSDDTSATQKIITHELVHVFHGQHNISPDFSEVTGIDWFVEGLAVFASGQLDESLEDSVRQAIREGKVPVTLDHFWTGKLRYGLSGALVKFIDVNYGRAVILSLLPLTSQKQLLTKLGISENELISSFKASF